MLTGFTTVFLKSGVNLAIVKILAVLAGPGALAIFSQLLNLNAIMTSISTGSATTGVVTLLAENRNNIEYRRTILSTVYKINFLLSILLVLFTLFFSDQISITFLGSDSYSSIIILVSICSSFWGLLLIFTSILNGLNKNNHYLRVNILSTILFGLSVLVAFYTKNVYYFVASYFISQVVGAMFVLHYFTRHSYWSLRFYFDKIFSKVVFTGLIQFVLMSFAAVIFVNLSLIIIRTYLISHSGAVVAGLWDSMTKVSLSYFGILSSGLSIYYLPKIAASKSGFEIKQEIFSLVKLFLPLILILFTGIYFLREYIILLLFTHEFLSIKSFFLPVLFGDIFKWLAWLYSYILLARKETKLFLLNEAFFTFLNIVSSLIAIYFFSFEALFKIYPFIYFFYFVVTYILVNKKLLNF